MRVIQFETTLQLSRVRNPIFKHAQKCVSGNSNDINFGTSPIPISHSGQNYQKKSH